MVHSETLEVRISVYELGYGHVVQLIAEPIRLGVISMWFPLEPLTILYSWYNPNSF